MPPRKRKAEPPADVEADTTKSVLGGMKGGYRVTGEEAETGVQSSEVPFQGKAIICQRRGSKNGNPALIFTHGAGGGLDNPATKLFAEGFAKSAPVICFQGTMNLQSRTASFGAVIDHEKWGEALGGRSMGARAAVICAQGRKESKNLVLVSYPLTSPKGEVRDQILLDLPSDKEVLFIIGDGDNMCNLEDLAKVRTKMKAKTKIVIVEGADHGMSLKAKAGVEAIRRRTGELAAEWLESSKNLDDETVVRWDTANKEATTSTKRDTQTTLNWSKGAEKVGSPQKRQKKS